MPELLTPISSLQLRQELQQMVTQNLLGPAGDTYEEIEERNDRGRYILGLLAPKGQTFVPNEQDDAAAFLQPSTHGMQGDCTLNFCQPNRGLKSTTDKKSALKRTQDCLSNTMQRVFVTREALKRLASSRRNRVCNRLIRRQEHTSDVQTLIILMPFGHNSYATHSSSFSLIACCAFTF